MSKFPVKYVFRGVRYSTTKFSIANRNVNAEKGCCSIVVCLRQTQYLVAPLHTVALILHGETIKKHPHEGATAGSNSKIRV